MPESRLFKPLRLGSVELQHRIAMAPLTRLRASAGRVPTPLMKEYYGQRASVPGTLIITESTTISPAAGGGFARAPGIWNEEQVAAWRTITDEVHRRGSLIFCQLFAMGRAASTAVAEQEGVAIVGPSAIAIDETAPVPRPMTVDEIRQFVEDFAAAARNAVRAGFDGVECHGANGYLIDQFIQSTSNQRTDAYGGSVENRSRFAVEVLEALVAAVGPERVGLRLSPWSDFQGMRMADPVPQFSDVISRARHLNLAYLHLVEPRVSGSVDAEDAHGSLDFAYRLWDRPLLVAGGYQGADAQDLVDREHPDKDIVVVFGRYFISNPDLAFRIKEGVELSAYNRHTFYTSDGVGYVDYPFSEEYVKSKTE